MKLLLILAGAAVFLLSKSKPAVSANLSIRIVWQTYDSHAIDMIMEDYGLIVQSVGESSDVFYKLDSEQSLQNYNRIAQLLRAKNYADWIVSVEVLGA